MVKSDKPQHFRKKSAPINQPKQQTLDSLPEPTKKAPPKPTESKQKKQILITEIGTVTREDELKLKVSFRLSPSRVAFSKIIADLFFDEEKMDTIHISILSGPLTTDNSEFTSTLNMKGISAGPHNIRFEMYEPWNSGEKLNFTSKELPTQYAPVKREDRLIQIPIVKHTAGTDLQIVSKSEKNVYRELTESIKKDQISQRDKY